MRTSDRHHYFATCAPGLEPLLHAEVRALRLANNEQQVGGVSFDGTIADAWRANLELRTAIRVLLRLSRFDATDADALYRGVEEVDWQTLLAPEGTLWVDARTSSSELSHSRFVEQRTKDAIVDQLRARTGKRPTVDRESPDLRLNVHLHRDRATLSIDTSGDSLHRRGWRRAQGRAPLAETLAAALIQLSGWDRRAPLLDPFVGSGTILVEAGLLASGTAPGLFRPSFGFERLPGHDARAFAALRETLRERIRIPRKLRLIGGDVDPARIEEARANAASAGLEELMTLEVADARSFDPRPGWNAWIVTNPPYGERMGREDELVGLYRAFGELLRARCGGYSLALLTASPRLADALGLPDLRTKPVTNGGLDCALLSGRLD